MNDIVVLNHGLEGVSLISKHSEHRDPHELVQYKHTGCSSFHGMYGFELFVSGICYIIHSLRFHVLRFLAASTSLVWAL